MHMYTALKFLHLAAAIVWLGGMAFTLLALRPSLPRVQAPDQRLALLAQTLGRFFTAVWVCIATLLASGLYMLAHAGAQAAPLGWHLMSGLGVLMMLIFAHLYFAPFRRLRRALDASDWAAGAQQAGTIAQLVRVNFVLGWLAVAAVSLL
jgi:uncharacterized membrane protein